MFFVFFQSEDGIRDIGVTGVQTCALPIYELRTQGVEWTTVTLHVGLDTFRPVQVEDPEQHQMHSEYFELSQATADALNRARAEGRRVIAVGTTTVRVLETVGQRAEQAGLSELQPFAGNTDIFIYPPY